MFQVDLILLLLAAAALIGSVLAGNPKPFRDSSRHVLVCSAHSDDCVIMGAEYAYGAIQNGLSVRIAYLTCSGPRADAEICLVRKKEALAAWSALGVPAENLTFADLTQSPIDGPANYSDQELACAGEIFKAVILSLPKNAAVIVPAQGELHYDHRTVRALSLQAIVESQRDDLVVYETPEYNSFLSLVRCPKRTIRTLLRHLPFFNRLIRPYAGPSNYVNGPPGFVFRDKSNRLAKKRELLTYFTSQDGDLLVRYFGYETPYRRVGPAEYLREPHRPLCVSAFGGCCDPSALALGLTLMGVAFLTAHEVAVELTIAFSPPRVNRYIALLGGLLAIAYFVRRVRRTANLETSLFVWAAALGLISGAL